MIYTPASYRKELSIILSTVALLLLFLATGCSDDAPTDAPEPAPAGNSADYAGDMIVDVEWVKDQIENPGIRIIDLSPIRDYESGHIPGAEHVWWQDTIEIHNPVYGMLTGAGQRADILDDVDITNDTAVVVYDNAGGRYAARFLWMLRLLGHTESHLLNGGVQAWQAAGEELSSEVPDTSDESGQLLGQELEYNHLIGADELGNMLESPDVQIIDNRTADQAAETWFNRLRIGTIPGSTIIPWTSVLAPDGHWLLPAEDLREVFTSHGLSADQPVVVFGLHGTEAAITWVALRVAGYEDVRLYDGSWSEWGADHSRPVEERETAE